MLRAPDLRSPELHGPPPSSFESGRLLRCRQQAGGAPGAAGRARAVDGQLAGLRRRRRRHQRRVRRPRQHLGMGRLRPRPGGPPVSRTICLCFLIPSSVCGRVWLWFCLAWPAQLCCLVLILAPAAMGDVCTCHSSEMRRWRHRGRTTARRASSSRTSPSKQVGSRFLQHAGSCACFLSNCNGLLSRLEQL